jgi:hypothetical protein
MGKLRLIWRFLNNDRLKEYDAIIQMAQKANYKIISLRDYSKSNYDTSKKIFILRHDVDRVSKGTREMFNIEQRNNVFSSFYFRNITLDPMFMKEIESYGSESSFHFESIADYIRMNPYIKDQTDLYRTDFKKRCLGILKANIDILRLLLDIPCITIASHGTIENRMVDTPNNVLTEDVAVYDYLGIKLEAYDKNLIDRACYISDSSMEINNGYRYGITPFEAIRNNEKFIIFLSHPNHWYYTYFQRAKKIIKILFFKSKDTLDMFRRI